MMNIHKKLINTLRPNKLFTSLALKSSVDETEVALTEFSTLYFQDMYNVHARSINIFKRRSTAT